MHKTFDAKNLKINKQSILISKKKVKKNNRELLKILAKSLKNT